MELDTASVVAMLKLAGIEVSESRLPDLVAQLERIRAVAAPVMAAPLEPADEQAPVWRP
jgi:Asp-tRNA(Asn)/Glu-tRNA(Gln) amidotransferase C subunit